MKEDNIMNFLKNDKHKIIFSMAKSFRRKKAQWLKNTGGFYFPCHLRILFYGSGRKQFLKEKEYYFIK